MKGLLEQVFSTREVHKVLRVYPPDSKEDDDSAALSAAPAWRPRRRAGGALQLTKALYTLQRQLDGQPITCQLLPNHDDSFAMSVRGHGLISCSTVPDCERLFQKAFPQVRQRSTAPQDSSMDGFGTQEGCDDMTCDVSGQHCTDMFCTYAAVSAPQAKRIQCIQPMYCTDSFCNSGTVIGAMFTDMDSSAGVEGTQNGHSYVPGVCISTSVLRAAHQLLALPPQQCCSSGQRSPCHVPGHACQRKRRS